MGERKADQPLEHADNMSVDVFTQGHHFNKGFLRHHEFDLQSLSKELLAIQAQFLDSTIASHGSFDRLVAVLKCVVGIEKVFFGEFRLGEGKPDMYYNNINMNKVGFREWMAIKKQVDEQVFGRFSGFTSFSEPYFKGEMTFSGGEGLGIKENYALLPIRLPKKRFGYLMLTGVDFDELSPKNEELSMVANSMAVIQVMEEKQDVMMNTTYYKGKRDMLDMVVKHTSDIIGVYDLNWRPVYMSPSVESILGYSLEEFVTPDFYDHYREDISEIHEEESGGVSKYRYHCRAKDGSQVWLESTVDALYNEEGQVQGYVGVSRNISAEVAGEKRLEGALQKEKELNKMKSQFISITSHEFKTPLSTIKSSIEICNIELERQLEKHPSEEKFRKHFNRVNNEVDRMNSLLVNLLNLEKINQGVIQVNTKTKKVNAYLRAALEDWLDQDAVTFHSELQEEVTHALDVSLMNQVISNLVENALKYGSREVAPLVKAAVMEEKLVISVRDFGEGIPKDDQENLFKPFFRASNSNKYEKGSGLGLMITRKFVELQDGKIHFESEEGKGTCFFISFDLKGAKP